MYKLLLLLLMCALMCMCAHASEKQENKSLLQHFKFNSKTVTVALEVHARSNPKAHKLSGLVNIVFYNGLNQQEQFKYSEQAKNSLFNYNAIQSIYGVFNDHSNRVQYEFDSFSDKTVMYSPAPSSENNQEADKMVAFEIDGGFEGEKGEASYNNAIVESLNTALLQSKMIDASTATMKVFDKAVEACMSRAKQNATVWHSTFLGKDYIVCASQDTLQIIGKDIFAVAHLSLDQEALKQFKARTNLVIPKHQIAAVIPVQKQHAKSFFSTIAKQDTSENSVPWFKSYDASCQLEWSRGKQCEKHEQGDSVQPKIPAPQRICIFLHGAGNEIVGEPVNNTWSDYWGSSLPYYTPQCSERWYIREDTVHYGWDDHRLQQRYCQLALRGQTDIKQEPGKPPIIRNKVIFAHSMANLILAAAIKHGYCDFDNETSSWYSIQAPYLGSPAASYLSSLCRNSSYYDLFYYTARWLHLCNATTMTENRVYRTLEASYCDSDGLCVRELEKLSSSRRKGGMCGNSAMGLFSSWSVTFYTLSTLIGFQEFNDGLVGISSCQFADTKYDPSPYASYYLAAINHRDGTCFNGNGWLSQGAPCDFYVNKY